MKTPICRAALVATLLGTGCDSQAEPLGPPPAANFRGFALTSVIWDRSNIPVCWESLTTSTAQQRQWVRDAVARTWEAHSDVAFAGWGGCTENADGIRIQVLDARPQVVALGSDLDGIPNGMRLNFTYNNWSRSCQTRAQACSEDIAVHEFGHALGFAHEHNRGDTPSTCTDAPEGGDGDLRVGEWDLHSVMNYCNPANLSPDLSETDIQAVAAFYGPGEPRVLTEVSVPHGGNLWANWWERAVGGACSPGTIRTEFSMTHAGPGDCQEQWSEWFTEDADDCRVIVRGWNAAAWLNGTCDVTISEKPIEPSSNWDIQPGVCRDENGRYPRWSALHDVTVNACLQECIDEPGCQGAAYDDSRDYCQIFGAFGNHGASAPGTTVSRGDTSQPGFECYLSRSFSFAVTPGVCRDDQGQYPRWGSLSDVTLEECLATCTDEASCQGAAYDPSRDYCQVFGSFGWYGASSQGTTITGGDMSQPGFTCYVK